jgi:S-adenosylmethionine:tRNA ribosyltransferase-isomerase
VIAVGTSVARALEASAAAHDGAVVAESSSTDLLLGPAVPLRVVDGLLTGIHDDERTSHFALLRAFASRATLERAFAYASSVAYLGHELGDEMLLLSGALPCVDSPS